MAVSITSKNKVKEVVSEPSNIEFRTVKENASEGIRRIYHGDNINVLRLLCKDKSVVGKVKLVYIDPPYNTGGDFETRNQVLAYSDNDTVQEYLSKIRARLELLHTLLSRTGTIYVHLDSKMVFHVKLVMDEIFGPQNFKGMITRKKCKTKNWTSQSFGNISDYILYYGNGGRTTWNKQYLPWEQGKAEKEYPYIEEGTGRRYKKVPIHAPGIRNGATGTAWRGMLPPKGKHWQYRPEELDKLDARGEIYWSRNGNPRRKVYLDNSEGIPYQDIWMDFLDVNNQNTEITGYPTEKNLDMLKLIVKASSNPNDIVLDCYAGSGTTIMAAQELNRQWIGIDCGDEAIRTMERRLRFGRMKMKDYDRVADVSEKQGNLDFPDDNPITYDLIEEVGEEKS